ncbi:NUDIX domain-containing protein [Paenibacillus sp. R14(2021)]|uniref:NUDIX hydrolase n=1 Tax=Paenibacillus sp. R14(2021) TaxID=2859228 RepID=UPI001C6157CA|nr:NUDIX domain-containing protein [Paenibacillus sp. R14(2021)]
MRTPIFFGAVHLLFYRNEEVLLLKRKNTGFEDGKWSVVAGRIDGGEEVKSAAIREAKEEAGVDILPEDLDIAGVIHRKNGNTEWIDFYLNVRAWRGVIVNAEPHKCEALQWFDRRALPEPMIGYIRTAIGKNRGEMWFDSLGW